MAVEPGCDKIGGIVRSFGPFCANFYLALVLLCICIWYLLLLVVLQLFIRALLRHRFVGVSPGIPCSAFLHA